MRFIYFIMTGFHHPSSLKQTSVNYSLLHKCFCFSIARLYQGNLFLSSSFNKNIINPKEKTLYNSTIHETVIAGCLRPNTTITQSLSHKRTLISIGPKEKTLHSSMSNIIWEIRLYYRKTPRRFHRLTHDRNKIWYYTYVREQY